MKVVVQTTDYRITCDDNQWVLATKTCVSKGELPWKRRAYYARLDHLLDDLLDCEIKSIANKTEDIKDLIKVVTKARESVIKIANKL